MQWIAINTCPVAFISPESRQLVEILNRSDKAHRGGGASLYGTDLSQWPARMVDAQVALQQEQMRTENAYTDSIAEGND